MRKVIRSQDAPQPRGVYSQAIESDGFVFVSGQGPVNPLTNQLETGNFKSQVRQTLRNIERILEAAGSSLREVTRLGVFLADLNDFGSLNEVFREFFPDNPPARTTVGAQLPLPQMKVEIDCIARRRENRFKRPSAKS